jgi:phosphohistidine phosphatase SixA
VLAVGHEPLLSRWIAQICLGGENASHIRNAGLQLKKGAIAAVAVDAGGTGGRLLWLMQPRELRRLQ